MSHPTPVWDSVACVWRVDLRKPWGFGRYVLDAPDPPHGLVLAVHAARDKLDALRADSAAAGSQLSLPGTAGKTFEQAILAYVAEREYSGTSGEWLRNNAALLRKELGRESLGLFTTEAGASRLLAWRDDVRGRGIGARSMKDRLNVFRLVWRWCAAAPRLWVSLMPVLPSPKTHEKEVLHQPAVTWVDESTFRAVRGAIYASVYARLGLATELRRLGQPDDAAAVHDLIERRRLYLSNAFYTGMRRADLNGADDSYVSRDFDCYWRFGQKTGIEKAAEAIPAPFAADLLTEYKRLGRPWHKGELICGGPWFHATRVIATAARKLGVQTFDLMTCRRSFVYHKALAGVPEAKLVNLMGHTDSKMIRSVYLLLQPRLQRDEAGAAWPKSLTAVPGTGAGRILPFPGK